MGKWSVHFFLPKKQILGKIGQLLRLCKCKKRFTLTPLGALSSNPQTFIGCRSALTMRPPNAGSVSASQVTILFWICPLHCSFYNCSCGLNWRPNSNRCLMRGCRAVNSLFRIFYIGIFPYWSALDAPLFFFRWVTMTTAAVSYCFRINRRTNWFDSSPCTRMECDFLCVTQLYSKWFALAEHLFRYTLFKRKTNTYKCVLASVLAQWRRQPWDWGGLGPTQNVA